MTPDDRDTQIRLRIAQDVMASATASYWRRRAATLEWARPRPTDYRGQSTPADIRERDDRLRKMAQSCREHADLCEPDKEQVAA